MEEEGTDVLYLQEGCGEEKKGKGMKRKRMGIASGNRRPWW